MSLLQHHGVTGLGYLSGFVAAPLVWMDLTQPWSQNLWTTNTTRIRTSAAGNEERDFSLLDRKYNGDGDFIGAGNNGFLRSVYAPHGGTLGQSTAGSQPQVFENGQWLGGARCASGAHLIGAIGAISTQDFWFYSCNSVAVIGGSNRYFASASSGNNLLLMQHSAAGNPEIRVINNAGTGANYTQTIVVPANQMYCSVNVLDRDGNWTSYLRAQSGITSSTVSISAFASVDFPITTTARIGDVLNYSGTISRFGIGLGLLTQGQIDQLLALPFPT